MQIGISEYSNATSASFIMVVARLIGILPVLYAADRLSPKSAFRVTNKGVFYAFVGGLLRTFGLFFRYVALETIPITIVSTINGTNPIITLVLSYFLIRNVEYIDRRTIVGIVASAVSVALLSY
jgi:drug/metabolite transporter (DMT)-like permease